jgi:glycosyltransferase involved in cell wall biosynthesis
MKVLHLPTSVGGMGWALAEAERARGIDARVLVLYQNDYRYPADIDLHLEQRGLGGRLAGHVAAFVRHRTGVDAYHFNYGSSLVHFLGRGITLLDLPFYDSRARKVFTFNGCDARQKFPTMARNAAAGNCVAACFAADCYGGMCNSGELDRHRQRAIEKAARYADHFFAVNPDLLYFLPREKTSFLPYAVARGAATPKERFFEGGSVHIVHAPTQRAVKGTAMVLAALEELRREEGDRVRVTLVEKRTHAEAQAIYRSADLVVDQLLVGWYGAVAVEAMYAGVPVACYINDDHLQFVPTAMADDLPVLRVTPQTLLTQLRRFVRDRDLAWELSVRGRAFAGRWHDPAQLARITEAAYRHEPVPSLESLVCAASPV